MRKTLVYRLVLSAVLTALSIVLCRFLGFPQSGLYRIEIGFLPIAAVAMMFGPVWGGVAYGLSDFIGAAIFTGVNPFITLAKVAFGVVMGLLLREKNGKAPGILRISLTFLLIGALIDVAAMTPIFIYMFNFLPEVAFSTRSIAAAVNLPVRILLTWLMLRYLGKFIYSARVTHDGGCKNK